MAASLCGAWIAICEGESSKPLGFGLFSHLQLDEKQPWKYGNL